MANHAFHHNDTKTRGGDRRSAKARADQGGRSTLVTEISERRQRLDQMFYDHLRRLRRLHGDRAVDQALAAWQAQRDAVAIAPSKVDWRQDHRGPQLFRKDRAANL